MYCVQIKLHFGATIDYYVCSVTNAVLTGDKNALECFLRYGYEVKEFHMQQFNEEYYNINGQRCTLGKRAIENSRKRKHQSTKNKSAITDPLSMPELDETSNSHGCPRRNVVNEVFIFVLKLSTVRSPRLRANLIQCFRLVWMSRPTPYVRSSEISELTNKEWLNKDCPFKCWENIEEAESLYRKEFGEIAMGTLMPRSLQQLCRCAMRRAFMKSYAWDWGIKKLNLPNHIISYLRLEF